MRPINAPITMPGGKFTMLKHILPLLAPRSGETNYIEPFVGTGVVILNKERHASEVVNDANGEIVNLLRVLRDPEGAMRLHWQLIQTPVSRQEFLDAQIEPQGEISAVERAARFVTAARQCFGGYLGGCKMTNGRWRVDTEVSRLVNKRASEFLSPLYQYPLIQARLYGVILEHADAFDVIRRHDTETGLIYADPPYVGTETYYAERNDAEFHAKLSDVLNGTKARVVLSYFDAPEVRKLYPESRWTIRTVERHVTVCGMKHAKAKTQRTELILTRG